MQWLQMLLDFARQLFVDLGGYAVLALAAWLIRVLQKHNIRVAYMAAIVRAVGDGQDAAQAAGQSLFSAEGRKIAAKAGAAYLMSTMGPASKLIGIVSEDDHIARVSAQIGAMQASAAATAVATAAVATAAASLEPPALVIPAGAVTDAVREALATHPSPLSFIRGP